MHSSEVKANKAITELLSEEILKADSTKVTVRVKKMQVYERPIKHFPSV